MTARDQLLGEYAELETKLANVNQLLSDMQDKIGKLREAWDNLDSDISVLSMRLDYQRSLRATKRLAHVVERALHELEN